MMATIIASYRDVPRKGSGIAPSLLEIDGLVVLLLDIASFPERSAISAYGDFP
jgi:hypothetical protein